MNNVSRRVCFVSLCVGLLAVAGVAEAARYSVKAVAVNGTPITPTDDLLASPGDRITIEIYGSEWSPESLKAWQITLDKAGFMNQGSGALRPLGWDRPMPPIGCSENADCPAEYPICYPNDDQCIGPDHDPSLGCFRDRDRPDYIYYDVGEIGGVDFSVLDYRYAYTLLEDSDCPDDDGTPRYFATLIVDIEPDACGAFGVALQEGNYLSEMRDCPFNFPIEPMYVDGLTIDTGEDCGCFVESTLPENCAIDARHPSAPDGSSPAGWNTMVFTFDTACNAAQFGPSHFSVRHFPAIGIPPTINSVLPFGGYRANLLFSRRISTGVWTCVRHIPTGTESCIAHLPGDVTNDRTSAPSDILRVIDCINGVATCTMEQGDVDRSTAIGPPDILRVIDLLNGAGVYNSWLNVSIPACPTAP